MQLVTQTQDRRSFSLSYLFKICICSSLWSLMRRVYTSRDSSVNQKVSESRDTSRCKKEAEEEVGLRWFCPCVSCISSHEVYVLFHSLPRTRKELLSPRGKNTFTVGVKITQYLWSCEAEAAGSFKIILFNTIKSVRRSNFFPSPKNEDEVIVYSRLMKHRVKFL